MHNQDTIQWLSDFPEKIANYEQGLLPEIKVLSINSTCCVEDDYKQVYMVLAACIYTMDYNICTGVEGYLLEVSPLSNSLKKY